MYTHKRIKVHLDAYGVSRMMNRMKRGCSENSKGRTAVSEEGCYLMMMHSCSAG